METRCGAYSLSYGGENIFTKIGIYVEHRGRLLCRKIGIISVTQAIENYIRVLEVLRR